MLVSTSYTLTSVAIPNIPNSKENSNLCFLVQHIIIVPLRESIVVWSKVYRLKLTQKSHNFSMRQMSQDRYSSMEVIYVIIMQMLTSTTPIVRVVKISHFGSNFPWTFWYHERNLDLKFTITQLGLSLSYMYYLEDLLVGIISSWNSFFDELFIL